MNIIKVSLLLTSFVLAVSGAIAQNAGKISGSISSKTAKAAEGATVSLLRSKDSVMVKLSAANKEGQFTFEKIRDGKYLISVTAVGHRKSFSKAFEITPELQSVQLPAFELVAASKDLAGVTVTAKRPLVEQRIDRTIV